MAHVDVERELLPIADTVPCIVGKHQGVQQPGVANAGGSVLVFGVHDHPLC